MTRKYTCPIKIELGNLQQDNDRQRRWVLAWLADWSNWQAQQATLLAAEDHLEGSRIQQQAQLSADCVFLSEILEAAKAEEAELKGARRDEREAYKRESAPYRAIINQIAKSRFMMGLGYSSSLVVGAVAAVALVLATSMLIYPAIIVGLAVMAICMGLFQMRFGYSLESTIENKKAVLDALDQPASSEVQNWRNYKEAVVIPEGLIKPDSRALKQLEMRWDSFRKNELTAVTKIKKNRDRFLKNLQGRRMAEVPTFLIGSP